MTTPSNDNDANVVPLHPKKCPTCGKPETQSHRPFCSKRCANLDLGKWLNEEYRIASVDGDDADEDVEENTE